MNSGKWYLGKRERILKLLEQLNAPYPAPFSNMFESPFGILQAENDNLSYLFFFPFLPGLVLAPMTSACIQLGPDASSGPMVASDSHAQGTLSTAQWGLYKVLSNLPMALVPPAPGSWAVLQIVFISNERPSQPAAEWWGFSLFLQGCEVSFRLFSSQQRSLRRRCSAPNGPVVWEGGSNKFP